MEGCCGKFAKWTWMSEMRNKESDYKKGEGLMPKLVSMERISLKGSKDVNEKMIQEYIFDNPACLGLGDLTSLTKEKTQPAGGVWIC
jgi:hypothetical protein